MSRVIKVEDAVYTQLDTLRVGRQTFSDVIKELLTMKVKVFELVSILEGQTRYRQEQIEREDAMTKARAERADLEARTLK